MARPHFVAVSFDVTNKSQSKLTNHSYIKYNSYFFFVMNAAGVEVGNPVLEVLSVPTVVEFLQERKRYLLAIEDKNTGVSESAKIKPISLKASVTSNLLEMICEMELSVSVDQLTNELLEEYLSLVVSTSKADSDHSLCYVFEEIEINKDIKDVKFRIGDLWHQFIAAKNKYKVKDQFSSKKGKKIFRREMAKKLWPNSLKWAVQEVLDGISERSTEIKNDDKAFYRFCIERAKQVDYHHQLNVRHRKRKPDNNDDDDNQRTTKFRKKNNDYGSNPRTRTESRGKTVKCLKCNRTNHRVRDCRFVKDDSELKQLLSQFKSQRRNQRLNGINNGAERDNDNELRCIVQGCVEYQALLDSGASQTTVPRSLVDELKAKGVAVVEKRIPELELVLAVSDCRISSTVEVELDLELETKVARTTLRHVSCIVVDGNMQFVCIGEHELRVLGLHPMDRFNQSLRASQKLNTDSEESQSALNDSLSYLRRALLGNGKLSDIDESIDQTESPSIKLDGLDRDTNLQNQMPEALNGLNSVSLRRRSARDRNNGRESKRRRLNKTCQLNRANALQNGSLGHTNQFSGGHRKVSESKIDFVKNVDIGNNLDLDPTMRATLDKMIESAVSCNILEQTMKDLRELVYEYADIWRTELGKEAPARVTPLKLRLKPNARPRRCRARRYPPKHRDFMNKLTTSLVEGDCIFKNPHSRWCSPAYCVPKPHNKQELRMTIDLRYPNSKLEKIAGVMPILSVVLQQLEGSAYYSVLDAHKGYW